jgi:hypothetical protein
MSDYDDNWLVNSKNLLTGSSHEHGQVFAPEIRNMIVFKKVKKIISFDTNILLHIC